MSEVLIMVEIPTNKRFKNLLGNKYHRLLVESYAGKRFKPSGQGYHIWNCICDCGNTSQVASRNLLGGFSKSCGCLSAEMAAERGKIHGMSKTSTHKSWSACVQRCRDENSTSYPEYGGAGITVCDRWLEPNGIGFTNFLEDMGERPSGHTLNRIGGAKIYSKETCEWATLSVQAYDQKLRSDNKTGVTGVYWYKNRNKYVSTIALKGKVIHLGYSDSLEGATTLRKSAEVFYYGFTLDERREQNEH